MNTWTWKPESAPPADGLRVLFYSDVTDFVHVGCWRAGEWYDEENVGVDRRGTPVEGVRCWTEVPEGRVEEEGECHVQGRQVRGHASL